MNNPVNFDEMNSGELQLYIRENKSFLSSDVRTKILKLWQKKSIEEKQKITAKTKKAC